MYDDLTLTASLICRCNQRSCIGNSLRSTCKAEAAVPFIASQEILSDAFYIVCVVEYSVLVAL